jgi:hypothetical protein
MNSRFIKISGKRPYWIYLELTLFMKPPTIKIQGRMEHRARAKRQFFANAKIKPATNEERKVAATATFSDMP